MGNMGYMGNMGLMGNMGGDNSCGMPMSAPLLGGYGGGSSCSPSPMTVVTNYLKLATIISGVYLALSFLPVSDVLDYMLPTVILSIPLSDTIIKSILLSVTVIALRHFVLPDLA